MPENPLLPHAKLRELHTLMLRCRALERGQRKRLGAREALLAATAIHLLPGDLLCGPAEDATAEQMAPAGKDGKRSSYASPAFPARLTAAAAMARGLQAAGDGLVLAYTRANQEPTDWQTPLLWAQQEQLPLVLVCADSTGGRAPQTRTLRSRAAQTPPLTWQAMTAFSKRARLPVLAVDGEDAVAVFRVMQESVIRARYGGGPAVIWAVLSPPETPPTRSRQPLARLEQYLKVRKIQLSKSS